MTADELVSQSRDLRPPAPSVIRLLAILNRPDTDAEEVIRIVEQDIVLSAKVLAVCNSAWFGNTSAVASISQALLRLGFQQIHRIVMAVSFGAMMDGPLTGYAIENQELWRHSLLTALIARKILEVSTCNQWDPSIVFTAGLVHDIGKLVIDGFMSSETQAAIRTAVVEDGRSRVEAERQVLGCDHSEVGATLLRRWNLPENVVEAVANHHAPPLAPHPAMSAVVHLADAVAHEVGSAPGWESFAVPLIDAAPDALGISPVAMEQLMIRAFEAIQSEPELSSHYVATT